jgi:hypothetical protein
MQHRLATWATILSVSLASLGDARTAHGQPTPKPPTPKPPTNEECAGAYERAQLERREGKLQAAKSELRACASVLCRVTREECIEWLDEVQRSLPSVVFAAHTQEGDVLDLRVLVDGKEATTHLDGMAVEIDPGVHRIRFELAGREPIEMTVVVVEGQKNRAVEATWRDEPRAPPPPPVAPPAPPPAPQPEAPAPMARPVPTLAYVLGGAGIVGLAGFTTFALIGQSKKSSLDTTCAPFCTSNDLGAPKTAFAIADASLAVAIIAFASAGVVYFTRPAVPRTGGHGGAWGVSVAPGGARVDWRIAF